MLGQLLLLHLTWATIDQFLYVFLVVKCLADTYENQSSVSRTHVTKILALCICLRVQNWGRRVDTNKFPELPRLKSPKWNPNKKPCYKNQGGWSLKSNAQGEPVSSTNTQTYTEMQKGKQLGQV